MTLLFFLHKHIKLFANVENDEALVKIFQALHVKKSTDYLSIYTCYANFLVFLGVFGLGMLKSPLLSVSLLLFNPFT